MTEIRTRAGIGGEPVPPDGDSLVSVAPSDAPGTAVARTAYGRIYLLRYDIQMDEHVWKRAAHDSVDA